MENGGISSCNFRRVTKNGKTVESLSELVKDVSFGVALSGGGARGFAHVGALNALKELGIIPSVVAGVSAGSVIACMYAAGLSGDEMMKAFSDKKFGDLTELSVPKDGFFKMDKFRAFLRKNIPVRNLEDLPIPTYVCATDLDHGCYTVFEDGAIDEKVAASCSIPIVFRPVKINGTLYVDGGVLKNLPASIIKDKCDILIGVNVSPMDHEKLKPTILDIAHRSYKLMSKNNTIADMAMCDILIQPENIANRKVFGIKAMWDIAKDGYNATMEVFNDSNLEDIIKKHTHK